MKQIRFRAWDKVKKIMYSSRGYLHYENSERAKDYYDVCIGIYLDGSIRYTRYEGHCSACKEDVDQGSQNIIIMQFTGLKDKNGKDIYEGDIVDFKFKTHIERGIINDDGSWFSGSALANTDWEVIGNFYENPELIKETK